MCRIHRKTNFSFHCYFCAFIVFRTVNLISEAFERIVVSVHVTRDPYLTHKEKFCLPKKWKLPQKPKFYVEKFLQMKIDFIALICDLLVRSGSSPLIWELSFLLSCLQFTLQSIVLQTAWSKIFRHRIYWLCCWTRSDVLSANQTAYLCLLDVFPIKLDPN